MDEEFIRNRITELRLKKGVSEYQMSGIARILLREAMAELKSQGYKAAHILVAKDNVKALRSYEKLHFTTAGECELFGHSYWCYEKEL